MLRPLTLIFACALPVAACGSVAVERHIGEKGVDPPHRIFVVERIGPADHAIPVNFAAALTTGLAACRVEAEIVHRQGLELDDDAGTAAQARAYRPDAILDVRLYRPVSFAPYEGVFLFTLAAAANKRELWKATIRVLAGSPTGSNPRVGRQLGAEAVRLLASDGVLTSCPPPT